MKNPWLKSLSAALALAACFTTTVARAQGSLTPPAGPPAPTMKSLDQIEPRIDLQHAPASAVNTSDEDFHYVITQPGSYYLTGNIAVTKPSAIRIGAEGVTLDLNGFQISRAVDSGGTGIEILATAHRAAVRNGTIKGFQFGVHCIFFSDYARGCAYRDLAVSDCTEGAIYAGKGAVLESCRVHNNSGLYGIWTSAACTLNNCTAVSNAVTSAIVVNFSSVARGCVANNNMCQYGFTANEGNTLINCVAYDNTGASTPSAGFDLGNGSTVIQCNAYQNRTSLINTSSTGVGYILGAGSTIQECNASRNSGDGIRIGTGSVARNNVCDSNGNDGVGAGIHAITTGTQIEGNLVSLNDRGIEVTGTGNTIFKNRAHANGINYVIAADNVFGAIVDRTAPASAAVSGNTAASSAGTTDPWANFAH